MGSARLSLGLRGSQSEDGVGGSDEEQERRVCCRDGVKVPMTRQWGPGDDEAHGAGAEPGLLGTLTERQRL